MDQSGQTLRQKGLGRTSCFAVACALRSPHQVRENPAGQTPSDLGVVRVIHALQIERQQSRCWEVCASELRLQMGHGKLVARFTGATEVEFLLICKKCLRCGVGASCLSGPVRPDTSAEGAWQNVLFCCCVCLKIPSPGS